MRTQRKESGYSTEKLDDTSAVWVLRSGGKVAQVTLSINSEKSLKVADFPSKNTGVENSRFKCLYCAWKWRETVSCWAVSTLHNPMDCRPPGLPIHGILQARIHEWAAIPFSRWSAGPRDGTWVSRITARFFTVWVTRECLCACVLCMCIHVICVSTCVHVNRCLCMWVCVYQWNHTGQSRPFNPSHQTSLS